METDYEKILSQSSTWFLSLFPAVDRILSIFGGLKSYFLSQMPPSLFF
ncbi:hypothetical protein X975_13190, partial [Stegodyphus mimosarum]